jgi:folate-binding protein YgfZ
VEQHVPLTPIAGAAPLELLIVAGPDRERLLHGLVTGEVRKLDPGAVTHGFVTSPQGRILADYRLLSRDGSFWLLVPPGTAGALAAHLEKYKLASRVEIRAVAGAPIFELWGEPSEQLLRAAGAGAIMLVRDPVTRAPRFFPLPETPELLETVETWLNEAVARGELRLAAESELELARVEAGELRFGVDFDGANFPQETGREEAVSYTKGCYLGQEVVARIHYRGGVQKRPCALRFDGAEPPPAGTELTLDGRSVGRATSVASSPSFGAIGLGILHQRGAELGTRLEHEGGAAEVVSAPFGEPPST